MLKRLTLSLALSALLLGTLTGCGLIENVLGGGGRQTSTMWADVPMPSDMTQLNKSQLPLPIRLIFQALLQSSPQTGNVQLENFEVIVYETPKTTSEITQFYTNERMAAAGWNMPDMGCADSAALGADAGFAGCMFGKQNGNTKTFLGIMANTDPARNVTEVYYIRIQSTER